MKPHRVAELVALAGQVDAGLDRGPTSESMQLWVDHFGARTAGWLVWRFRRMFRLRGAYDFKIPKSAAVPPWFRVAIATLRQRQWWSVAMVGNPSSLDRVYRVRWLGRGRHKRRSVIEKVEVMQ